MVGAGQPARRASILLCVVVSCFLATSLVADLSFSHTSIAHQAPFGEEEFRAVFPFANDGDESVRILHVRSSCGCTVPELTQDVFVPGESGEITAVFSYGARTGHQHKTVYVTTSEGQHALQIEVNVPVEWTLDRRSLIWQAPSLDPQQVHARFFHGVPLVVQSTSVDKTAFQIETIWSERGDELTLEITPQPDVTAGIRRIDVELRNAHGTTITIPLYLRVI